jgi:hypothetical protein
LWQNLRTSGRQASCCSELPDCASAVEQTLKIAAVIRIARIVIFKSLIWLAANSAHPSGSFRANDIP